MFNGGITEDCLGHWPIHELADLRLEMGLQCNVRCSMCYQTGFSSKSMLPELVWKERLSSVFPFVRTLTMVGGEPTILKNCRELVQLVIREYPNISLSLSTNGLLFKGAWVEAFLTQGACVNVSLNAIDPQLYVHIVRFGRQHCVMKNIAELIRRRNETNSRLIIGISSVIIRDTVEELPAFVQWAVDHGLDQVDFHTDHAVPVRHPNPTLVQRRIAETYEIADKNPHFKLLHLEDFDWFYGVQNGLQPIRSRRVLISGAAPCSLPFHSMFVSYNGWARAGCMTWYPFGNLMRSSIEEVWNSHRAFLFRKRILNLNFKKCCVLCDLNPKPTNPNLANLQRAYWAFRRSPQDIGKKVLRTLRLASAHE